jgi:hypothetical protein
VQPTSTTFYTTGERVTHTRSATDRTIWIFESKLAVNTTEPGRDATFDRWWLPVSPV